MSSRIGIRLAGDGRLVDRLTPEAARALFARVVKVNRLTRHELSLFDLRVSDAPAIGRFAPLPGDPADPAVAARIPLVARLRYNRSLAPAPRASHRREDERAERWPRLAHLAAAELRRVAGLVSARVIDGVWRLDESEGRLSESTILDERGRARRVSFVPLFGALFVVERLEAAALHASPGRDVIVERRDRSLSLVRFEGVVTTRGELARRLRDRARLDRAWEEPLVDRSERAPRRFFAVRAAVPQEGFAFTEAPELR